MEYRFFLNGRPFQKELTGEYGGELYLEAVLQGSELHKMEFLAIASGDYRVCPLHTALIVELQKLLGQVLLSQTEEQVGSMSGELLGLLRDLLYEP